MVCIRQATVDDLLQIQAANLLSLPENYQLKVGCAEGGPQLWSSAAAAGS